MQVTCNRCAAQFRLARHPGRAKLRCPSCQWYFRLDESTDQQQDSPDDAFGDAQSEIGSGRRGRALDQEPIEPSPVEPDPQQTKGKFWIWAGFTLLITALLLVYPITEYQRFNRANQQYANAISNANAWLEKDSLDGFEIVYEDLSNCIGHSRISQDESLEQLRDQVVEHREAIYAENKRLAAAEAIANQRWQEAETLLLEYLIEGFGEQEEQARASLAEVQQHLDPNVP
jgi:hypothetical protein